MAAAAAARRIAERAVEAERERRAISAEVRTVWPCKNRNPTRQGHAETERKRCAISAEVRMSAHSETLALG